MATHLSSLRCSGKESGNLALQKGLLTHRMLQMLPSLPQEDWEGAAYRYLERPHFSGQVRNGFPCINRFWRFCASRNLLRSFLNRPSRKSPSWAPCRCMGRNMLFQGASIASSSPEISSLSFWITRQTGSCRRARSRSLSTHRAQLAIYSEILKPLYPDHRISCVLVYTETAKVIELSTEAINASLAELRTK